RVFEVHPELAFWRLNGGGGLGEAKKGKGRCPEPRLAPRRQVPVAAGFSGAGGGAGPAQGGGADDLLDALACAAIARRIRAGLARPFPDPPERDAFGLTMAIWA